MKRGTASTGSAVIGVDIGGSKTAAGVVLVDGTITARGETPTPSAAGAAAVIDTAAELIDRLVRASSHSVRGVGVGSAGIIDSNRGTVVSSTSTFTDWVGTPLRSELARRTDLPVEVDNDVDVHALGELWCGAARGVTSLLYVAVGTGVGAAFAHNGRLLHGSRHAAGEIGHLPTPRAGDRVCTCGTPGHLEAIAAGPSMAALYSALSSTPEVSLHHVSRAAQQRDPIAMDVIRVGGAALGQALGGLINVLDPDLVIIGGGVTNLGVLWWDAVRTQIRAEAIPMLRDTPVIAAGLGADAAVLGAASLIWEQT